MQQMIINGNVYYTQNENRSKWMITWIWFSFGKRAQTFQSNLKPVTSTDFENVVAREDLAMK